MKTLIVLIGPTGVGKTELSLRLAEHFRTCIVSADSRQLYADLKIGTAAPTPEQQQRVRHYFVGTLQLTDYYSAAQYETEVLQLLEKLYTEHEVVLLTGGSMMYVDAVCKGIDDIPTVDAETRRLMLHKYETEGLEHLCAELKLLDPEYYKIVDLKNHKRVIHALEICYMTGKTYTSFRTQQKKERPFRIIKIGLTRDREELYARINQRVEQMITDGLVEEARNVYPHRALNSLNTVGYKEIFNYLDGEWTLPFAIEKIQQNSRIYSRKQIKIPTPKFVVFYNGDEEQPERKEIRLSKAFSANTGETNMELVVLQININKGQNEELKAACKTLQEYAEFTERAREHRKEMELEDAIRTTIDECIRDGILKDFLLKNKAEVYHMCLYEFDVELHERVLREEEREEGRLEGIREGRLAGQQEGMQNGKKFAKQVFKAFLSGKTPEAIAEELNVPVEEVKNLVD